MTNNADDFQFETQFRLYGVVQQRKLSRHALMAVLLGKVKNSINLMIDKFSHCMKNRAKFTKVS